MEEPKAEQQQPVKLIISCVSQEYVEPANLAMEQSEELFEWMNEPGNRWMLDPDAIFTACRHFHPDWKYDPTTRELTDFEFQSKLWERWERLIFSPDDATHVFFTQLAEAKGRSEFHLLGKDDYRGMALVITAQLAYYESDMLMNAIEANPIDTAEVWRRLYWFTRFVKALKLISYDYTPSEWSKRRIVAANTRAWKRDAWAYLIERKAKNSRVSDANVAADFVKLRSPGVGVKTIQDYYTERKRKSIGRGSTDTRN